MNFLRNNKLQMGYGSRALQLLKQYYEMKIPNINEESGMEESVTEIKNVPDEAVGLLEETIGKMCLTIYICYLVYIFRTHIFRILF